MLILKRYVNQRIIVNTDLIINIHEITDKAEGWEVELSFDGPRYKYAIDREEVYLRKIRGVKRD